jgi:glycerophosphoryl diester phosphodiesterase
MQMPDWPYPFWIAHRGAGKLAPENTMAAFERGHSLGWRMAECDVTLSADDVPFLLHDPSLERTTNGRGAAALQPWSALQLLDAGRWHGERYAGERLLSLESLAAWALRAPMAMNLEIKPGPGREADTGRVVARMAAELWRDAPVAPLLSSFEVSALEAASEAAAHLPRALLLQRPARGWTRIAARLRCVAVVFDQRRLDAATIAAGHAQGLRVLTYTVNDAARARQLQREGVDGIISDALDRLGPG